MFLLQKYNFEIVYTPGKCHVMADHFSWIGNEKPPVGVNDQLLDANLFSMEFLKKRN